MAFIDCKKITIQSHPLKTDECACWEKMNEPVNAAGTKMFAKLSLLHRARLTFAHWNSTAYTAYFNLTVLSCV